MKKKNEFENIRKIGNHIQFTISNVKDSSDIIIKEDGLHVERKQFIICKGSIPIDHSDPF